MGLHGVGRGCVGDFAASLFWGLEAGSCGPYPVNLVICSLRHLVCRSCINKNVLARPSRACGALAVLVFGCLPVLFFATLCCQPEGLRTGRIAGYTAGYTAGCLFF